MEFITILSFLGLLIFGVFTIISWIKKDKKKKRNLIITVICLIVFISGLTQYNSERVYAESMDEGKQAIENKDYKSAIKAFEIALEKKPDDEDALELKEDTEKKLRKVLFEKDIQDNLTQAQEALDEEDYETVISLTDYILARDSNNAEAKLIAGKANKILAELELQEEIKGLLSEAEDAMNDKEYSTAITAYDDALELDPDNSDIKELKDKAKTKQAELKKQEEERERQEEEKRIAKQKENEAKEAEIKAQKEKEKNATSNSGNSNQGSSSQSNQSNTQSNQAAGDCTGQIKGSVNGIYHTPGSTYYSRTKNVAEWFCTEEEARNAGYRAPKR